MTRFRHDPGGSVAGNGLLISFQWRLFRLNFTLETWRWHSPTLQMAITRSAHYRFAVTGPDGSRSIEASPRALDAETDQAPVVQLMAPAEPLDVSNLRRVELAYVIEDDFGISGAELVWESGKDHGRKLLYQLVEQSDVFVTSFLPATRQKLSGRLFDLFPSRPARLSPGTTPAQTNLRNVW